MRTKLSCITIFLIFFISVVYSQIIFEKKILNFSGSGKVILENDSGYIMVGGPTSTPSKIIQFDNSGNIKWSKIYSTSGLLSIRNFLQTNDGNYLLSGWSIGGFGSYDCMLFKINNTGDTIWTKKFGSPTYDVGVFATKELNNGELVLWSYFPPGGVNTPMLHMLSKTDSIGNFLWSRGYHDLLADSIWIPIIQITNSSAMGKNMITTSDKGFAFIGGRGGYSINDLNIYLFKTDSLGNPFFLKVFSGGLKKDNAVSVQELNGGGFIIGGITESFNDTLGDIYLIKTDSNGNLVWSHTYGIANSTDIIGNILVTQNNEFVIAGSFTFKVDFGGNLLWVKNSNSSYISPTLDNGFIATSLTEDKIIKMDSLGNSSCNQNASNIIVSMNVPTSTWSRIVIDSTKTFLVDFNNIIDTNFTVIDSTICFFPTGIENQLMASSNVRIYPNPFSTSTTIQIQKGIENSNLMIYNIFGQPIKSIKFYSDKITIDRANLCSGIYFYKLSQGIIIISYGKLIVTD